MITLRQISPSSLTTPYRERFEYLLVWISPNGGYRQWLFSHTDGKREEKFRSIIIDNNNDFRSVPNQQDITIDLMATSLNLDNINYVASIFESPRVVLVDKLGVETKVAIERGRKRLDNITKGFSVEFELMLQEPYLLNV